MQFLWSCILFLFRTEECSWFGYNVKNTFLDNI